MNKLTVIELLAKKYIATAIAGPATDLRSEVERSMYASMKHLADILRARHGWVSCEIINVLDEYKQHIKGKE